MFHEIWAQICNMYVEYVFRVKLWNILVFKAVYSLILHINDLVALLSSTHPSTPKTQHPPKITCVGLCLCYFLFVTVGLP